MVEHFESSLLYGPVDIDVDFNSDLHKLFLENKQCYATSQVRLLYECYCYHTTCYIDGSSAIKPVPLPSFSGEERGYTQRD